ncbi:unnamed protein product [Prunus armeniaca]
MSGEPPSSSPTTEATPELEPATTDVSKGKRYKSWLSWAVMWENETTFFLFTEGDGGPARFLRLRQASVLNAENLVRIGRADIVFDGVVGGSDQRGTTVDGGDHVDLSLVRVRWGWKVVHIFIQLPFTNKSFNDVAQGNTRFGIVVTELMKMAKDTCVWHRLVGRSPWGRLKYYGCLVH